MTRFMLFLLLVLAPWIGAFANNVKTESFNAVFTKASRGEAKAQFKLGEMYRKGDNVDINNKEAFLWYMKSADQGHSRAAYHAGRSYIIGDAVGSDVKAGLKLLKFSAKNKYPKASLALGQFYQQGKFVKKDIKKALFWYNKAKTQGSPDADKKIKHLHQQAEKTRQAKKKKRRKLASKKRRANKAAAMKKARAKSARKTVKKSVPTTSALLLKGGWKKENGSSEILPSSITTCKSVGNTIECLSDAMTRKVGLADIRYITKTVVFGLQASGDFQVSYRNNVLKVNSPQAANYATEQKVAIKNGWQKTVHSLNCKLINANNLTCKKDSVRTVKFYR